MIRNRQRNFGIWKGIRGFLLPWICWSLLAGCGRPEFLVGIGTGGKYLQGKEEITRPRVGDIDKAIVSLEQVVAKDPTYKDSLTLLGRAYYMKTRYPAAFQILQRAVAVNPEDEIAWMVLGITQLRLGDEERGVKSLQGGVTLFYKVSIKGYRGYRYWDRAGKVRGATNRAAFVLRPGFEASKEEKIKAIETLLVLIDQEEWHLSMEQEMDFRREVGGVGER